MTDINLKIRQEEDFILSPKYSNSLTKFLLVHDSGVSDEIICRLLNITESDLRNIHKYAIIKLKEKLSHVD